MKNPWLVTYWDDNLDMQVRTGCPTHEAAMIIKARVARKFNRTASVEYRGK